MSCHSNVHPSIHPYSTQHIILIRVIESAGVHLGQVTSSSQDKKKVHSQLQSNDDEKMMALKKCSQVILKCQHLINL